MERCKPSLIGCLLMVTVLGSNSHAAQDESRWEQEFLFMLEDAYLQEPGQWQLSVQAGYLQNLRVSELAGTLPYRSDTDHFWTSQFDLAVGLTERLQANVKVPLGYKEIVGNLGTTALGLEKGDVGDISGGLTLSLTDQNHNNWVPAIAVTAQGYTPSSDHDRGIGHDAWGWELAVAASKAVDDFFWHGNVAYRRLDDVRQFGQFNSLGMPTEADEELWSGGLALVFAKTRTYELVCEAYAEFETERKPGETEHREAWYLIPGGKFTVQQGVDIGLGVPVGLGGDTYEWGILAKLLVEW